jgi:hypothetical protein
VPPSVPQRTHWNVKVTVELLDQPPVVVVNVCPWTGDPETTGSDVLLGPAAATSLVCAESASGLGPSPFDATTPTISLEPASPAATA